MNYFLIEKYLGKANEGKSKWITPKRDSSGKYPSMKVPMSGPGIKIWKIEYIDQDTNKLLKKDKTPHKMSRTDAVYYANNTSPFRYSKKAIEIKVK